MGTRVALPNTGKNTGCYGLEMPDGTRYSTRPGGTVDVQDHHADLIRSSANAKAGLVSASLATSIGTKAGRWCRACRREWQAWSVECPRCGSATDRC